MTKEKSTKYHLDGWDSGEWFLANASEKELTKWAADPDCLDAAACVKKLAERERAAAALLVARAAKREELQANPFDPRTEVSADARHITNNLWIIFVLLPVVLGLLLLLVHAVS